MPPTYGQPCGLMGQSLRGYFSQFKLFLRHYLFGKARSQSEGRRYTDLRVKLPPAEFNDSIGAKGRNWMRPHTCTQQHTTRYTRAALRDLVLGFSREGEMKTLSQGRTARLRAAVDRYQAIDFDEPHQKRVRKTAPKCAPQSRMRCRLRSSARRSDDSPIIV